MNISLEQHLRNLIEEMKEKRLKENTLLGTYMGLNLRIEIREPIDAKYVASKEKEKEEKIEQLNFDFL